MPAENSDPNPIVGTLDFPLEWTVFAPYAVSAPAPDKSDLTSIPDSLKLDDESQDAVVVAHTRNQADLSDMYGDPPFESSQSGFIYVPFTSPEVQEATIGFGADYYLQVWLDGVEIFNNLKDGNANSPPTIADNQLIVQLTKGDHLLVARLVNGIASATVAIGGPDELRSGDFESILPDMGKLQAAELDAEADPKAPFRWVAPEGFDPNVAGLGLPQLKAAEHMELMHCHYSESPVDEGGTGVYESLEHGTWNHNNQMIVFQDRLIPYWDNHARDENGGGARMLAKVGRICNDNGDIDWGGKETLVEIVPPPVPVCRRLEHCRDDKVTGLQARGSFVIVGDRLIMLGTMNVIHGTLSREGYQYRLESGKQVAMPEHFAFGPNAEFLSGGPAHWAIDFPFYQEWGIEDGTFQPLSPIYRRHEVPTRLQLTTRLTLPLEPLLPPYSNAPLLSEAPDDLQDLVAQAQAQRQQSLKLYAPGTQTLTVDGTNGLAHSGQFQRPDGSWVILRDNKRPRNQPVFYAAERPSADDVYPPARRTNLFGSVNPAPGELPDGSPYIVANSPNRRNMFITLSEDGRVFDRTWLLKHQMLADYTPGCMKRQGGPGAGPQYFKTAVIGQTLWITYSISKEHIGATRIPIEALS